MQPQKSQKSPTIRKFSPYETTQLVRFGFSEKELLDKGELPVEYLTGHVDFAGLNFMVDRNVLIPRLETEELVTLATQTALQLYRKLVRPLRIVEVGTGSGALGISLARALNSAGIPFFMTLSDISEAALHVAQQNLAQHLGSTSNVKLVKRNLLEGFEETPLDLILANLPYIPSPQLASLDSSVKDFEPHIALDGGEDGWHLIEKLLSQALPHIAETSIIWLEVDESHTQEFIERKHSAFEVKVISDTFGRNRFARLKRKHLGTSRRT